MNYQKIYNQLITRAKHRITNGYYEKHHIIPLCMGGSNDADNLVKLTPEEHFVAHLLLVKMFPSHSGLIYAVVKMCLPVGERKGRKLYGWLKRKYSEERKKIIGEKNPSFGTRWVNDGVKAFKMPINESLPLGVSLGRSLKGNNQCSDCRSDTGSKRANYCKTCRGKRSCGTGENLKHSHFSKVRTEEQELSRRQKISNTVNQKYSNKLT